MPLVIDKARTEATPPTTGERVEILQSQTEPHIESFDTDGTANPPLGLPAADDRAHKTGSDTTPP